jgi:cytochrome c5
MSERNEQWGGRCASPVSILLAAAAAIVLPIAGFFVARSLGGGSAADLGEESVLRRIQPIAQVALADSIGANAAAKADEPAAAGKKVYEAVCVACHASGVAGAPKFGDKGAWAPRLASGLDALTASVIKGKGAMPPKGGNASLPDADIRAAVEYMTAAAK